MDQRHRATSLRYCRYIDARRTIRVKAVTDVATEMGVTPSGVRLSAKVESDTMQKLSPRLRASFSGMSSSFLYRRKLMRLYPGEKAR